MRFPKYPEYKSSRLDIKTKLPSSWTEAHIKRAFEVIGGSTPKTDTEEFWDGDITWVTPADLSGIGTVEVSTSKRSITKEGLSSCGTTLIPSGSIVISTRAPIGTIAISGKELCTNQGCKSLVPNGACSSRFTYYFLSVSTEQLNIKGKGTTFLELSGDELGSFLMPVPTPVEQKIICNFLDRETVKIDALITEQERLIELLIEKRQAVISHALTKGLNPNAPMKDSGVEWLGEVPEHWMLNKIGVVSSLKGRLGWQGLKADEYTDEGPYVVSSAHFRNHQIQWKECPRVSQERYETDENIQLAVNDVLLMKDGAVMGKLALVETLPGPACLNSHLLLFRPHEIAGAPAYQQKFAFYFMQTKYFQQYIHVNGTGATFLGISQDAIRRYKVCWPPLLEQTQIATFLDQQTSKIDSLIDDQRRLKELLKERRSALISAAVTGQIDVRGLVAEEEVA